MNSTTSSEARRTLGLALGLTLLLTTLLVAFGLPALHSAPRDLPVALVAPDAVAQQVVAGLDAAQPGAFDVARHATRDEAHDAIRAREVYGAFVLTADGLAVDVASAASPAVSQVLTQVGSALGEQLGLTPTVTDVVALSADDPRGIGLTAGALPIALGGYVAGAALSLLVPGTRRRFVTLGLFAVLAGLAMTAVLQWWFGTLTGSYLLTSGAAILGILATGTLIVGLERALGAAGLGIGALLVVVLGNPLSGLSSAPEMLPQPWGAVGQLLPPGATGSLLRSTAFFDAAGAGGPVLVLLAWCALGVVGVAIGARRGAARRTATALAPADPPRAASAPEALSSTAD